jgi:hypothetical protein
MADVPSGLSLAPTQRKEKQRRGYQPTCIALNLEDQGEAYSSSSAIYVCARILLRMLEVWGSYLGLGLGLPRLCSALPEN